MAYNLNNLSLSQGYFCHFGVPLRLYSGRSISCRGGPKLQNKYSNIKIGQEITSELRKIWGNLKFLHDHDISQLHQNHLKSLILVFEDCFSQNFTIKKN